MKKRQLAQTEQEQLSITKLFHQNRLNKPFNWKKLILAGVLEIGFIVTIYYFNDYGFSLLAKLGVVVVPIWMWMQISGYKEDRKESKRLLDAIAKMEQRGTVEFTEYTCTKAIRFEEAEDVGICYAMEIGENRLMFWWDVDYTEFGLLPNTRFEALENQEVETVLGKRIQILGDPIQPVVIRPEIRLDLWDKLPSHREVIESSGTDFLETIEWKYTNQERTT